MRVPVHVEVGGGEAKVCSSEDLSVSGLRMDITGVASLSELTGGRRDVPLRIALDREDPVRVVAEAIWTARREDGGQSSGWMFCAYQNGARERLAAFIEAHGDAE